VSLYLCGATVQAPPHIGHIRSGVVFDILTRWLRAGGYQVTFCRNVTDIDDKILRTASAEGSPWWAVAERNQRAFTRAYDVLGCLPPDVEPRATGHVPEMITLIRRLIDSGHGYAAGGDVHFGVSSYDRYGALSGQRPEHMRPADDIEGESAKRDPRDFALWKGHKPGEPYWDTPWGPGRPGWHLECSAMATKYLGPTFDIHGGGLDLVFPHHENELAQSRALGHEFARIWTHNGMLEFSGEKMSKSLGNDVSLRNVLDTWGREVVLLFFMTGHWRKPIDFTDETLQQAKAQWEGFEGAYRVANSKPQPGEWQRLVHALDDDFNTVEALAILHDWRSRGYWYLLDEGLRLFGLGLPPAAGTDDVEALRRERDEARAAKDWARADALRDRIRELGFDVVDESGGSRIVPL